MPRPKLSCEALTTVKRDGACACRYTGMYQRNKSACGCVKGREFVAGKGCVKPRKARPSPPSSTSCEAGFRRQGGRCVLIQQKRATCPQGYRLSGNVCRRVLREKKRYDDLRGEGGGGGAAGAP